MLIGVKSMHCHWSRVEVPVNSVNSVSFTISAWCIRVYVGSPEIASIFKYHQHASKVNISPIYKIASSTDHFLSKGISFEEVGIISKFMIHYDHNMLLTKMMFSPSRMLPCPLQNFEPCAHHQTHLLVSGCEDTNI